MYIKRVLRGIKTKWHYGILDQILVGKKQLWKTFGRQLGQSEHEVRIRGYQGVNGNCVRHDNDLVGREESAPILGSCMLRG